MTFVPVLIACVGLNSACSFKRIDSDGYLNSYIGKPLSKTPFEETSRIDSSIKTLVFEDDSIYRYRYRIKEVGCMWDVDVEKVSLKILRWEYPTVEAQTNCRDMAAVHSS
jgi:hypothetical protein